MIKTMLLICVIWPLNGCILNQHTPEGLSEKQICFVNRHSSLVPYPCALLRLRGYTKAHVYADPDYSTYTQFRVLELRLLDQPARIWDGSHGGAGIYPLLVWGYADDNIVFSPGFNPEAFLGHGGIGDEYYRIQRDTRDSGNRDAEFNIADKPIPGDMSAGVMRFQLIPVKIETNGRSTSKYILNHSMIVFLLNVENCWTQIRSWSDDPKYRQQVILIRKTIAEMADAHLKRWPDFRWTAKQQKIVDWCKAVQ